MSSRVEVSGTVSTPREISDLMGEVRNLVNQSTADATSADASATAAAASATAAAGSAAAAASSVAAIIPPDPTLAIEGRAAEAKATGDALREIRMAVGTPLVASTIADMTDQTKAYVYTGSETGYTAGNWYYYDTSLTTPAWVSGGVYNSTAFETDTTLTVPGAAADAKVTGDKLTELKSALNDHVSFDEGQNKNLKEKYTARNNIGLDNTDATFLSNGLKDMILNCFKNVAWLTDDFQTGVRNLFKALYTINGETTLGAENFEVTNKAASPPYTYNGNSKRITYTRMDLVVEPETDYLVETVVDENATMPDNVFLQCGFTVQSESQIDIAIDGTERMEGMLYDSGWCDLYTVLRCPENSGLLRITYRKTDNNVFTNSVIKYVNIRKVNLSLIKHINGSSLVSGGISVNYPYNKSNDPARLSYREFDIPIEENKRYLVSWDNESADIQLGVRLINQTGLNSVNNHLRIDSNDLVDVGRWHSRSAVFDTFKVNGMEPVSATLSFRNIDNSNISNVINSIDVYEVEYE